MKNLINKCSFAVVSLLVIGLNCFELLGQVNGAISSEKNFSYRASDWCNKNVPVEYWLSQKQISSILHLQAKYDEIILPEIAILKTLHPDTVANQLSSLSPADGMSSEEIIHLKEKLFELRLEARSEIRKILSTRQIVFFDDFIFSKWWAYK